MKKKEITDLKNKTVPELEKLSQELQSQIGKAKMDMAMRKAKNTNLAKSLRKTLAVVLSTKHEKEIYANA